MIYNKRKLMMKENLYNLIMTGKPGKIEIIKK